MKTKIKKEKSNFTRNTLIFVLILVVLGIFAVQISYYNKIVDVRIVEMSVNISDDGFGFNNSEDSLNFGKLTRGDTSKRVITLSQEEYDLLNVKVKLYGGISRFITTSENYFELKKGEVKEISFILTVPITEKIGSHSGYVKIILTK